MNEKTLTFCIFLKESQKEPSKIPVIQKSKSKTKANAKVPKSISEPKNSKTHYFQAFCALEQDMVYW